MNCKGCRTEGLIEEHSVTKACVVKQNAPKRNCPCEDCIVKTACFNQCDKFQSLVRSIFNLPLSYDYKYVYESQFASRHANYKHILRRT